MPAIADPSVSPQASSLKGNAFPSLAAAMVRLEFLRHVRGWKWRVVVLALLAGAYWFGRRAAFGIGGAVWFPGASQGVVLFSVFFAMAAVILGVDLVAQWDRRGALVLLATRLQRPVIHLVSGIFSVCVALILPVAVAVFWPAIGAWRAGFQVLWSANAVYLATTALPLVWSASAAGIFARLVLRNDLAALGLGMLLMIPLLVFRLLSAPAAEVFTLASPALGILIPIQTLLREGLATAGYGFLFLGASILLIPPQRPERLSRRGFFRIDLPSLRGLSGWASRRLRRSPKWGLLWSLAILLPGALAAGYILPLLPRAPGGEVNWARTRQPEGLAQGRLAAVDVISRHIRLPDDPKGMIEVSLELMPASGESPAPYAAIDFGGSMKIREVRTITGHVNVEDTALAGRTGLIVLRLDPLLETESSRTVSFTLEPDRRSYRLWERAWHPRYGRFAPLGSWYGEPVGIDYPSESVERVTRPAPFTIDAPNIAGRTWMIGGADSRQTANGRVLLEQRLPEHLHRLIAADLVEVAPTNPAALEVHFLVQKPRANLAENFHRIYEEPFTRARRLLGTPPQPIAFFEVPEAQPEDPLALSSATLDQLDLLLPDYDRYGWNSSPVFHAILPRLNRGIVEDIVMKRIPRAEHPELLRDALTEYLHRYALDQGRTAGLARKTQRDLVLVPWTLVPGWRDFPFDIPEKNERDWRGPALALWREESPRPIPQQRLTGFIHLLRGMIGEEAFRRAIPRFLLSGDGSTVTLADFQNALEQESGEDLSHVFREWLRDGVVPRYRIREAQAFLFVTREERAMEYRVDVTLANDGDGNLAVPWILVTEGDPIRGRDQIPAGSSVQLSVGSPDRPLYLEIDPEGWIPQSPPAESRRAQTHPRVYFRTVTQL